jgi:hypothetical protein
MTEKLLHVGGASGFWGDAARATSQLIAAPQLDYLVYDYLAEITMSILARSRAQDDSKGYAVDFIHGAMRPNLGVIAERGIKVVSNAGGVNPAACAHALQELIAEHGLNLKVACVIGDDLMAQAEQLKLAGTREMFSDEPFPPLDKLQSINAYLGAFPIAHALARGADIVITGRCVDSAVTLGACIHAFGWTHDDLDRLAMGSLAGHILECGPQATGGNFTDWESVPDLANIGYPIAEISADGSFVCTKPEGTGGLVSVGTVSEQMLYEIGDPQNYLLPDVVCDFSTAELQQVGADRVRVTGATGRPAPDTLKVSATWADQFRGGTYMTFYGFDADRKARALGDAVFQAARGALKAHGLPDFSETSIELIGAQSQYGQFAEASGNREVAMKLAAKHPEMSGIGILLKEAVGLGLATPPGLSGFAGSRPRPSPVVRLFSCQVPRDQLEIRVEIDGERSICNDIRSTTAATTAVTRPVFPAITTRAQMREVPLIALAWGRSGDKGDKANVGIIARQASFLPYICAALTEDAVAERFAHFLARPGAGSVERYLLPGINAVNFLLHEVLGGGGTASIRNDPQGKGYAQLLLACPVPVPVALAETL